MITPTPEEKLFLQELADLYNKHDMSLVSHETMFLGSNTQHRGRRVSEFEKNGKVHIVLADSFDYYKDLLGYTDTELAKEAEC